MKRKILICGATGFIGRNMAQAFAATDNFKVYGTYFRSDPFNDKRVTMVKADLTDAKDVARAIKGVDIVIQAAAATSGAKDTVTKPYVHVVDNAVMNALIFRSAFDCKVKHLIFLSCTTMYPSSDVPLKEIDLDLNHDINRKYFGGAWTKVYNEKMCEFYSRLGGTRFTVIRHSNIYGPYDKFELEKSHVFAATVVKVMCAGDDGKIVVWGKGREKRDLLYVDDLIDFVRCAIKKQKVPFDIFNAGCGSAVSVKDFVKKIIQASGYGIRVEFDPSKPSINTKLCLNISRAKKLLGWSPRVSLENGIEKTLRWYRDNIKLSQPC